MEAPVRVTFAHELLFDLLGKTVETVHGVVDGVHRRVGHAVPDDLQEAEGGGRRRHLTGGFDVVLAEQEPPRCR